MKSMQIQIDDVEIIPNNIRATATYAEPDTSDLGPTVVVTINIERGQKDHRQLSIDAEKEVERVLRDILELK